MQNIFPQKKSICIYSKLIPRITSFSWIENYFCSIFKKEEKQKHHILLVMGSRSIICYHKHTFSRYQIKKNLFRSVHYVLVTFHTSKSIIWSIYFHSKNIISSCNFLPTHWKHCACLTHFTYQEALFLLDWRMSVIYPPPITTIMNEGVQKGHSPLTVSSSDPLIFHSHAKHNALQSDELTDQ